MGYLIYEGGCKFENVSPHDRGKREGKGEWGRGKGDPVRNTSLSMHRAVVHRKLWVKTH